MGSKTVVMNSKTAETDEIALPKPTVALGIQSEIRIRSAHRPEFPPWVLMALQAMSSSTAQVPAISSSETNTSVWQE